MKDLKDFILMMVVLEVSSKLLYVSDLIYCKCRYSPYCQAQNASVLYSVFADCVLLLITNAEKNKEREIKETS